MQTALLGARSAHLRSTQRPGHASSSEAVTNGVLFLEISGPVRLCRTSLSSLSIAIFVQTNQRIAQGGHLCMGRMLCCCNCHDLQVAVPSRRSATAHVSILSGDSYISCLQYLTVAMCSCTHGSLGGVPLICPRRGCCPHPHSIPRKTAACERCSTLAQAKTLISAELNTHKCYMCLEESAIAGQAF